jgi:hypothetical protein
MSVGRFAPRPSFLSSPPLKKPYALYLDARQVADLDAIAEAKGVSRSHAAGVVLALGLQALEQRGFDLSLPQDPNEIPST